MVQGYTLSGSAGTASRRYAAPMDTRNQMPAGTLGTGRVIIGALILGLVAATGVMYALVASGHATPSASGSVLLLVLAVLWPSTLATSVVLSRAWVRQARADWQQSGGDRESLLPRFLALTILRGALLEGSGIFGAVVYMMTGQGAALLAPVLSAGLMLTMVFPTRERFEGFVRDVTAAGV
jgi:hypothetical protein